MYDLSYFNLGFRSDSVSNLLTKHQTKEIKNKRIIEDAFLIIKDCLKIKDDDVLISSISPKKGYGINTLLPLLAELYLGKDLDYIIDDLELIYKTIDNIKTNQELVTEEEFNHVIDFFSQLSQLCLSNSAHLSGQDHYYLL